MKKMDDDEEITVALQATGSLIKMDTCKVILNRNYNRCKLPSSLSFNEADIDKIWIERSTQNSKLYNGTKFRLHSMSMQRKQLHLQIGITCYKDFLGTNWSPESARILEMGNRDFGNSQAYMADAIGVGTLLVTNDQMVVIIKRSQHCGEAPGLWDIPGGHPEPQELVGKISMDEIDVDTLDASDVVQEIFSSILREIQDEINIPQTVLSKPELMGIARNNTSAGRPSLEFLVRCKLGSKEIIDLYNKGSQCEADESTQIRLLTLSEVFQLTDNNNDFWNCLAPSAKGCIILFNNLVKENLIVFH